MARKRGQQTGHLKRQGDVWYLAYREDALDEQGKLIRIRRNARIANAKEVSKREAQRIARETLRKVDDQAVMPLSLITVEEFIETRFKPDVVWALKHAGHKHYEYVLGNHVIPALGTIRLRDVDTSKVQKLVKLKIEEGYSVQTAVHIRNAISAVFTHAKRMRAYIGDNPVEGVRMPEMSRKEAHALTFEQSRDLLLILAPTVRAMALLSITTSLNVAEMLGLRWKRVNVAANLVMMGAEVLPPFSLAVRENYYRGKFGSVKAKSRMRNVPLSRAVVDALQALRSGSKFIGPEDLVFATRKGTPLSERNILGRSLNRLGKNSESHG